MEQAAVAKMEMVVVVELVAALAESESSKCSTGRSGTSVGVETRNANMQYGICDYMAIFSKLWSFPHDK